MDVAFDPGEFVTIRFWSEGAGDAVSRFYAELLEIEYVPNERKAEDRIARAIWDCAVMYYCGEMAAGHFVAEDEIVEVIESSFGALLGTTITDRSSIPPNFSEIIMQAVHAAAVTQPTNGAANTSTTRAIKGTNSNGRKLPDTRFPMLAKWLQRQLDLRGWDENDLYKAGGPEPRTSRKVLEGFAVRSKVRRRILDGLNHQPPKGSRYQSLTMADIPKS